MPPRRPKPKDKNPPKNKNPTKNENPPKNVNPTKDENPPNDTDSQDKDHGLRKVDVELNEKLDVPECYTRFFKEKGNGGNNQKTDQKLKLKIKVDHKKGKKTSTTISWEHGVNPFPKEISEIETDLKIDFGTSCSVKNDSLVLFGNLAKRLKDYIVNNYDFDDDQIEVNDLKFDVPNYFKITISTKEGEDYTRVKWDPKTWKDQNFIEFVDSFINDVTDKWKVEPQLEKSGKHQTVYLIEEIDISDQLFKYFTGNWNMNPTQIDMDRKRRDAERFLQDEIPNEYSNNPYDQMAERFESLDDDSYCAKMTKTIQDAYQAEQKRLENYVIKANLKFERSGSDKKGNNIWVTSFNILKRISIDGIRSGRFISEGDDCIVQYKDRKRPLTGKIVSINKGTVTAIFRISFGKVPPGCAHAPNEKEEGADDNEGNDESSKKTTAMPADEDFIEYDKEEEEEDNDNNNESSYKKDDDDDDDDKEDSNSDDYDIEEEEEEMPDDDDDNTDKPYSITFKPNATTFQRSALALMHLYDMPSCPIKNIITNSDIDRSVKQPNEININDASFDLTDSEFLTDNDKDNKNIMKYLKLEATSSQTKCVEMVIQNSVSIVHGPPGCGKTSSIALFVYHLLRQSMNEKKRILLCAYSNQAVENIAKFVSPICKALGKKMVWIPNKTMCFENRTEFEYATEEQKTLSFYKILTRDTSEAKKYIELQEKKWDLDLRLKNFLKAKRNKKKYLGKPVELFPAGDQRRMDDIQYEIEKNLISEADVVCCTLISSAKKNLTPFRFESVFIDEASQAQQMVSLIPLVHHPSKLVLLGDHKQLDSMVPDELKKAHKETMISLYLRLLKNNIRSVMLNTQFRMHPLIAEFPNREFYNGKIKNAPGLAEKNEIEIQTIKTPIVFVNVPDGREKKVFGSTYKNISEANVVERILNNLMKNKIPGSEVGVITPYHGQAELLRAKTHRLKYDNIRISSVDSFQGSERDFIILSLVRTNKEGKFGFLPDKRRINVSITRARKGLIIVGNFGAIKNSNQNDTNPRNEFLVDLCKFYEDQEAIEHQKNITRIKILVERPKAKPKSKLEIRNEPKFNPVRITKNPIPVDDTGNVFGGENEKNEDVHIDMETDSIEINDICDPNNTDNNNQDDDIEYVSDYDDDFGDDDDKYFAK